METLASVANSLTLSNVCATKYRMIYETLTSVHDLRHCQMYIRPNKEYFSDSRSDNKTVMFQ